MIMLHSISPAAIRDRFHSTSLRTPRDRQKAQRPAEMVLPSASPSSTSAAPEGSSSSSNSGCRTSARSSGLIGAPAILTHTRRLGRAASILRNRNHG
jgi:hypothetical protein